MVRSLTIAICVWLLCLNLFAAGTQGVYWEVRTGGNDLNGGGYNAGVSTACSSPGTDWSQQDSPHVTFDGVTITASTSGTSNVLTINGGYTVATTDKCNALTIASGTNFTAGTYIIIAVNAGANQWTLDANVSSGAGSGMVGRMGGGFVTLAQATAQWNSAGADVIWVQTGTYSVTTATVPAGVNSNGQMTMISGYGATHGDTGRATLTTATNSATILNFSGTARYVTIQQLDFTHTAGTRGKCLSVDGNIFQFLTYKVSFDGCSEPIWGSPDPQVIDTVEIKNSTATGITVGAIHTAKGVIVRNSYIHDNASAGLYVEGPQQGATIAISNSIFARNTWGFRIQSTNFTNLLLTSNAYVEQVNDGIITPGNAPFLIAARNNIFYGNGTGGTGYGWNSSGGTLRNFINEHNAYGSNVTGATANIQTSTTDIALAACNPFVSTTNDFSLSACGLTALGGVGSPGTIPGAGTGFSSVGPLPPLNAGAASGGNSSYVQ